MTDEPVEAAVHAASSGQVFTESSWLDLHFEAMRPEYEQAVRSVGIEPGWHVLDAGCGGGSFLPLLAELVGPEGRVTALDIAPDNVAEVERRVAASPLACPVEATVGSLLHIPSPDDSFDAVWIANVLMYLADDEAERVLAEATRVTRPGGLVAAKEGSGTVRVHPIKPDIWFPVTQRVGSNFRGQARHPALRFLFQRAGLEEVEQQGILIERWAPLDDANQHFFTQLQAAAARVAEDVELSDEGRAFWAAQADPTSPMAIFNHPEFAVTILQYVVTGRVPA